jgi:gliding motility-associated lipoprotein GldD
MIFHFNLPLMTKIATGFLIAALFSACGSDTLIPKPPTYLRHDFPKREYSRISDECPYSFELSKAYTYSNVSQNGAQTCHKDIDLGVLNGTLNFSYIEMDKPLKEYIDYALKKVEDHQVKAADIEDEQIIRPESRVYGTFFELKGNAASNFQFYLTDSTSRFVSGVVYMNARPNYDSLKPSLDYLKQDILHLMKTFEWKK